MIKWAVKQMQNRFRLKSFPKLMCPFLESAAAKVSLDFRIDWVYRKKTMKAYLNVSCWGNELWSKKKFRTWGHHFECQKESNFFEGLFSSKLMIVLDIKQSNQNPHHNFQWQKNSNFLIDSMHASRLFQAQKKTRFWDWRFFRRSVKE